MRERESEVFGVVQRAMGAMRVIQAFTREEDEHRRFMTASERSLAAGLRLYTLQTFYSGVVNLVIALGTAAVVWVGARHVLDGTLTRGQPGRVHQLPGRRCTAPSTTCSQIYGLAQSARVGVRRVLDVLDVGARPAGRRPGLPRGGRARRGGLGGRGLPVRRRRRPAHPRREPARGARPARRGRRRRPAPASRTLLSLLPALLRSDARPRAGGRRRRARVPARARCAARSPWSCSRRCSSR